ncbi:hypothetical protein AN957_05580 [Cytobacillus solani]|uniref:Uncharacterized protein n=1 Tax=Cytobacillus solani TaxID=1637975 RepID=A0A0Q3VFU5_9BACI|nr:hypothetical protein AMS60_22910 [Bacillus sp. FJAT-21945]KQL18135.1 hypothetical protein AN957_05580 [Cytobacillus solani]
MGDQLPVNARLVQLAISGDDSRLRTLLPVATSVLARPMVRKPLLMEVSLYPNIGKLKNHMATM